MNILILIIFSLEFISIKSSYEKLRALLNEYNQEECTPKMFKSRNTLILYNLYSQFNNYFNNTNDEVAKKCWSSIFNNMIGDYNYTNLYFYSGHKMPDIGDPISCVDENYTYLLALLTFDIKKTSLKIEDKITFFSSKERSNLGICIWEECNEYIKQILNEKTDITLKNNLNKIYNIKDIKGIIGHKNLDNEKYALSFGIKILGIILLSYFIIFIILKIIVTCCVRKPKSLNSRFYELKSGKKVKKDYLKEQANIIKEEDNEDDDANEEEEKEEDEEEEKDINKKDKKNKTNSKLNSKSISKELINRKNNEDEEEKEEENEEEEEDEDNDDNDDSKISNDSLFNKDIEQSKIKYIEKNLNKMNNINQGDFEYSLYDKYEKRDNLIDNNYKPKKTSSNFNTTMNDFNKSFLELIKINTLTEYKNQIYSNKGLEMITGLRTFFLLLITLNICFNLFEQSPAFRQINSTFLKTFLFGTIKYSSFGMYLWVYLDGLVYTFKLMNFVKRDRSFKNFAKFIVNLLPKIFVFLIIFYGVYFFQKDIGTITVKSIIFEQYTKNEYNYKCLTNPLYLIFPFINPITSENIIFNNYFNNCYQFTYLIVNEFYCIMLFILMFYFLYKYQSKILDIIISIIVLINILVMNFLPYFFENIKDEKYYLLKYVLGETFSLRYPHNMFNIFFIGIFSGLIYYYYYFSLKETNLLDQDYFPFQYLSNLMKIIFKCNWVIKTIFILITLGIIITDCLIYYILQVNNKNEEILFKFTGFLKIFYLYETPIIILSTSILLIFLLLAEDKFQIKSFLGSKIFYIMEKISFSYVCLIQMISLLFLSSSDYHGEIWTFVFFFFITFFEFFVGVIASFIFTLVFELPAKVLANNLRGKEIKEKKIKMNII